VRSRRRSRRRRAPYGEQESTEIAQHCTEREDVARKVERKLRKVAAAVLLEHRTARVFPLIITGVTPTRTFVRTIKPPVDVRIERGEHSLRVVDKVRVKLLSVHSPRGFIDFGRD
jgi:exoribonuclease-2